MNRGPALPTARVRAQSGCHQYCPRGLDRLRLHCRASRGGGPLRLLPRPCVLYSPPSIPFAAVSPARLAALAWGGLRGAGGHPRDCPLPRRPPSPYLMLVSRSLGCSSQPFLLLSCSCFLPSTPPVSCFPQPSVPKPFQSFRMTIIGKKEYAAFSFNLYFQSQRALQCPSCPPPRAPCPPLDDNQRDLS